MLPLPSPPPLLAVRVVFRSSPECLALSHVVQPTSDFLDSSVEMEFRHACKLNSVKLLDRIWSSCSPESEDSPADAGPGHGGHWTRRKYLLTDLDYNDFQFRHGMLEAVKHSGMEMVRWLFDHFRGGVVSEDVVEYAAEQGNLELLQFFHEHGIPVRYHTEEDSEAEDTGNPLMKNDVCWGNRDIAKAAAKGHFETCKWLHEFVQAERNCRDIFEAAVENGDLEILEWCYDHYRVTPTDVPGVMSAAVEAGKIDMMKWLLDHSFVEKAFEAAESAMHSNRLDIVEWLLEHNLVEALRVLELAASDGKLDLARSIYNRYWDSICKKRTYPLASSAIADSVHYYCPMVSARTMMNAVSSGNLDAVRWLFETFCDEPEIDLFAPPRRRRLLLTITRPIEAAAMYGHLEILKYLHGLSKLFTNSSKKRQRGGTMAGTGPTSTTTAMDVAASENHIEVVRWLHENRREGCTTNAMDYAAANGHLEILQWLHAHRSEGCTARAMDYAARSGHLRVVKWLHENTTAGCTVRAMDDAAAEGHLNVFKWLRENRNEGCSVNAMESAARCGRLDIVKWLHYNSSEGCTTEAIDAAAETNKFEVVRWLATNRTEGCTKSALTNAFMNHNFDMVLFLHSRYREGCTATAFYVTEGRQTEDLYDWLVSHYPGIKPAN